MPWGVVEVVIESDDNGELFDTLMTAGIVDTRICNSNPKAEGDGGKSDTVRPTTQANYPYNKHMPGFCLYLFACYVSLEVNCLHLFRIAYAWTRFHLPPSIWLQRSGAVLVFNIRLIFVRSGRQSGGRNDLVIHVKPFAHACRHDHMTVSFVNSTWYSTVSTPQVFYRHVCSHSLLMEPLAFLHHRLSENKIKRNIYVGKTDDFDWH